MMMIKFDPYTIFKTKRLTRIKNSAYNSNTCKMF